MKSLSQGIAHVGLILAAVFAVSIAPVFQSRGGVVFSQQQETKEERELRLRREKAQKQDKDQKAKEERERDTAGQQFVKLANFADAYYERDKDFREAVDDVYLNVQSQHAFQAYRINTTRATELNFEESEDKSLAIRRVLYDNPWVQDYVNRVGQRLVPEDSEKLYAFKVTYHPIPYAYTLSTGTILISTGMISLLDNEAQLAYILAHEMAHVYNDDWKLKVKMPLAQQEYNLQQQKKNWLGNMVIGAAATAAGAAVGGQRGAVVGAGTGLVVGHLISSYLNQKIGIDWETVQEDKADDIALKAILDRMYDTKEVPKLLIAMDNVARYDERTQLGFLGRRERLKQRRDQAERFMSGPNGSVYQELVKAGKLVGNTPEFNRVIADLKRDNGIEAFRFDMFQMARKNLRDAVNLRSDDARATFYYGRVLKLVGRTPEELAEANQMIAKAISLDANRAGIPEAQLQRALMLMQQGDRASQVQASQALKDYITTFQKRQIEMAETRGTLPANIDVLYDFIQMMGDRNWRATPPAVIRSDFRTTGSDVQPSTGSGRVETPVPTKNPSPTQPSTRNPPKRP